MDNPNIHYGGKHKCDPTKIKNKMNMISYEKLDHAVNHCPDTWTTALFLSLLKRVIEISVFNDIESIVAKAKQQILKDQNEERTETQQILKGR